MAIIRLVANWKPLMIVACFVLAGCNGADNDTKAIWSYEQDQSEDPDFQFYPSEMKTVGQITVQDSIHFITNALVQPLDTLSLQNSRALQSLLQMQTLYVKYDMEQFRENISTEIEQLEHAQKWLNSMKNRLNDYKSMNPQKVLVRKVECRFEYEILGMQQRVQKDKIYFIRTATHKVVATEDKQSSHNS